MFNQKLKRRVIELEADNQTLWSKIDKIEAMVHSIANAAGIEVQYRPPVAATWVGKKKETR